MKGWRRAVVTSERDSLSSSPPPIFALSLDSVNLSSTMYGALIAPSSPVHGGKPSSSGRKPPSTFARAASRVSPQFVLLVLFNVSILFYFHYHPVALPDPPALLEGAAFTSFTSNRHGSDHHHHIGSNGLSAASHKNDSSLATPDISTMTCELCIAEPSHPLCVYGLDNIRLSRAYEGSGHRVRKVIEKALRGEVVEISLIGASVSAGTGIPYRESSQGAQQWQNWFMEDFKRLFPKTVLHLGILPGMGSKSSSFRLEPGDCETVDERYVETEADSSTLP